MIPPLSPLPLPQNKKHFILVYEVSVALINGERIREQIVECQQLVAAVGFDKIYRERLGTEFGYELAKYEQTPGLVGWLVD